MITKRTYQNERGIIALLIGVVAMFLASTLALSAVFVFLNRAKAAKNIVFSYEAMYASEAGMEDALLRIVDSSKSLPTVNPYTLQVNQSTASITIGGLTGGARTITSLGSRRGRARKIRSTISVNTKEANFFYGAQVGAGGIKMGNGSRIEGNLFSNGSVEGMGTITGFVVVAGDGNKIDDITVEGDAVAYSCEDSSITGSLTYVVGGEVDDCTADGGITSQATSTAPIALPISTSTISGWKQDAIDGGTISAGDFNPPNQSTSIIGPGVIGGDMILKNDQVVILTGTVYVQGNIDIDSNKASIVLDSGYGVHSGVLVTDGWIHIKNNASLAGSGQAESYLMILTTSQCDGTSSSGCTHHDAAVDLHNNASGAIVYAGDGFVRLHNNVEVKEIAAYKLELDNNAVIKYETGLANAMFSSGSSGGWQVSAWTEIE